MHKKLAVTVLAACAALAVWWLADQQVPASADPAPDEAAAPDFSYASAWDTPLTLYSDVQKTFTQSSTADGNERAFLQAIRFAEGTAGTNGYRTLFGGATFSSFADHPRIAKQFRDKKGRLLWTSAAGAYQFMAVSPIPGGGSTKVNTWDRIKARLKLPDFSQASQDLAALELIREAGAIADVRAGRFSDAVAKVRGIWASLPGAGYSQPEKSLPQLMAAYQRAGGALA